MITFEELLSRADLPVLDELLPEGSGQIIRQINTELNYPSRLSKLVMQLVSPQGLLLQQKTRCLLIDILPSKDAQDLALLMGCSPSGNFYDY